MRTRLRCTHARRLSAGARSVAVIRAIAVSAAALAVLACSPKPQVQVAAPAGNWISLFNGTDLKDWTAKIAGHEVGDNYANTFRVENGLLKVSYQQYGDFGKQFGSLFYKKKLSNYWIRAEYRFVGEQAPGSPSWAYKNSGIQLHGQAPESMSRDQAFPVCVEFDLVGGHDYGSRPTGDVCRTGTRVRIDGVPLDRKCSTVGDITIRDDQWVAALAEVRGATRVRQIVNGVLVVEYTNLELDPKDADAGRLLQAGASPALGEGYVSLQSNGHPVEFRRIEILPIEGTSGG